MGFTRNRDNAVYGGDYRHLPSGLYVVQILRCTDNERPQHKKPPRFEFEYDIIQGEYKDFFKDEYENFASRSTSAFWTGTFIQNYTGKSAGYMDALINRFEDGNPSFRYRDDGGRCFEGFKIVASIQAQEEERNGYKNWRYRVMNTYSLKEAKAKIDEKGNPLRVYEDVELIDVSKDATTKQRSSSSINISDDDIQF